LVGTGKLDLVVASPGEPNATAPGSVMALLGNGDGTFQAPVAYGVGANPLAVAVADFNDDGALDLAVANDYSGAVSILLGNGDGTFQSAISYDAGRDPSALAVGDFNGDGFPDLAVSDRIGFASGSVTLLINAADWGNRPHGRGERSPRLEGLPDPLTDTRVEQREAATPSPAGADSRPQTAPALEDVDSLDRLIATGPAERYKLVMPGPRHEELGQLDNDSLAPFQVS
jgi:hypothetical protein